MRRLNCIGKGQRLAAPGDKAAVLSVVSPRLGTSSEWEANAGKQMSRFHITLVRPDGYLHTEAFREVAETLKFGLQSLGHTAHIQENAVDAMATNVLLGAHLL